MVGGAIPHINNTIWGEFGCVIHPGYCSRLHVRPLSDQEVAGGQGFLGSRGQDQRRLSADRSGIDVLDADRVTGCIDLSNETLVLETCFVRQTAKGKNQGQYGTI